MTLRSPIWRIRLLTLELLVGPVQLPKASEHKQLMGSTNLLVN